MKFKFKAEDRVKIKHTAQCSPSLFGRGGTVQIVGTCKMFHIKVDGTCKSEGNFIFYAHELDKE